MKLRRFRKILALVVVFTFVCSFAVVSPVAAGNGLKGNGYFKHQFKDVDQAPWAYQYISKLSYKKVIAGYTDGSFKPNKPVTKAEALAMVLKAAGLGKEIEEGVADAAYLPFKDTAKIPAWAKAIVAVAVEKGYLIEEETESFQANAPAKRAWVARLLVRAYGLTEELTDKAEVELPFKDKAAISEEFLPYVAVAIENSIINGYPNGNFLPNKPITRAEMAALLGNADAEIEFEYDNDCKVVGKVASIELTESQDANAKATSLTAEPLVQVLSIEEEDDEGSVNVVVEEDENDEDENDEDENDEDENDEDENDEDEEVLETIGSITVVTKKDSNLTFAIAKDVQVFVNCEPAEIGDVQVNDYVELIVDDGIVKYIEVKPLAFRGTVTVVNAAYGTITVDLRSGGEETYEISDEVEITLNGQKATLEEIQVGSKVTLVIEDGKVTLIKAQKLPIRAKMKVKERAQDHASGKHNEMVNDRGNGNGHHKDDSKIKGKGQK